METFGIFIFVLFLLVVVYFIYKREPKKNLHPVQKKYLKIGDDLSENFNIGLSKIKKVADRKLTEQYLYGSNWQLDSVEINLIYTFRPSGELLIIKDGIVNKGSFEVIIDSNSIIITENEISKMYFIVTIKNDIFHLKDIGTGDFVEFINQTKVKVRIVKYNQKEKEKKEKTEYDEAQLEYRRKTDENFRYSELMNNPLTKLLDDQRRVSLRLRNHKNGFDDYINELKGESKETSEIMDDYEIWRNGNLQLDMMDYLYFLDDNKK